MDDDMEDSRLLPHTHHSQESQQPRIDLFSLDNGNVDNTPPIFEPQVMLAGLSELITTPDLHSIEQQPFLDQEFGKHSEVEICMLN